MSSQPRQRPNAAAQQARCRARDLLSHVPGYDAAIAADPALKEVMDDALVRHVNQLYDNSRLFGGSVYGGALESAIAGARAGGLSAATLVAQRRPARQRRQGAVAHGVVSLGSSKSSNYSRSIMGEKLEHTSRLVFGTTCWGFQCTVICQLVDINSLIGSDCVSGDFVSGGGMGAGVSGEGVSSGSVSACGLGGLGIDGGDFAGPSVSGPPSPQIDQDQIILPVFFPAARTALRPALAGHLEGPRHIYVAFVRAWAAVNHPGEGVDRVLFRLRQEFPGLHLPDLD
ncbi:hypothetical protein N431DRAFT_458999 [Stipitochalara longipes BDJ]|nr:hypothetical protein N431DRAFT_458999 [Stipitochalara longipes BDJ]